MNTSDQQVDETTSTSCRCKRVTLIKNKQQPMRNHHPPSLFKIVLLLFLQVILCDTASPSPSPIPSSDPSATPTTSPTSLPTSSPTSNPTSIPTIQPTNATTEVPSQSPTNATFAPTVTGTPPPPTWTGCVDPNNPGGDHRVRIGTNTTICIVVSSGGNWGTESIKYKRFIFRPIADDYSHFTVTKSFHDLIHNDNPFQPNVTVHIESQQGISFLRRLYSKTSHQVFPQMTAIIDVKDGIVIGITFDNGCLFCDSDRCLENTYYFNGTHFPSPGTLTKSCFFNKLECDALDKHKQNDCDLHIYFVWSGTDVTGKPFMSIHSRFSAFPPNKIPRVKIPTLGEIVDDVTGGIVGGGGGTEDQKKEGGTTEDKKKEDGHTEDKKKEDGHTEDKNKGGGGHTEDKNKGGGGHTEDVKKKGNNTGVVQK